MIPIYLQGKSAIQICNDMRYRAFYNHTIDTPVMEDYLQQLEMLLLLAVKDALCSAGEEKGIYAQYVADVEGRAIAFLNMVLPYEEKKNV